MIKNENPSITQLWCDAPDTLPHMENNSNCQETIPCLVQHNGNYEIAFYNCHHNCWYNSDDYLIYTKDETLKFIQLVQ